MGDANLPFGSLYRHGFVRTAVAVPMVRVADPATNVEHILRMARRADDDRAVLTVFPELALSSYTADDLFHQDALQSAVMGALAHIVEDSRDLATILVVGAPLRLDTQLFNCAVVVHRGRVLGVVPKSYLPNYREFYEKRQFSAARTAIRDIGVVAGQTVPFGPDLIFDAVNVAGFTFHVEICEDLWTPAPPSSLAALAGATILVNLSASDAVIGKADYRRLLCRSQSGRCIAAYLYAAAGSGESTTDMAWDGHGLVYENGVLLAETERFTPGEQLVTADVDLVRLAQDRMRTTSFVDCAGDHQDEVRSMRRVPFEADVPLDAVRLRRTVNRFPYVPADPERRQQRCREVLHIQVEGLATRLRATGIGKVVVGVSGGLNSALALIVAAKTMERLGLPRTNVIGCTMPGFATSARTHADAQHLMDALGVTALEIDIRPSCLQMLRDLDHPAGRGEPQYDVTYENVQAGERASHLFRLANHHGALVVGTSDLSETALGWSTYGVGDQMSHYHVNASVPKTLVRRLVSWMIGTGELGDAAGEALRSILATVISPELIPSEPVCAGGQPTQSSEAVVGPFELQDFHLYHLIRFGYAPSRIAYLAHTAWGDRTTGSWPDDIPPDEQHEYDLPTIKRWLAVLLLRFIELSQFKRSALPNGPKVGSGGSLSPRGDWRAPSDATARAWLDELTRNVP